LALAQRQHFRVPGRYRVIRRRLFFDPQAPELSELGARALRFIAQFARERKLALTIGAEADSVSDGDNAAKMARLRADTVAEYLSQPPAIPIASIAVTWMQSEASEPYRRVVNIGLLEPCQGPSNAGGR
jgi:hypothetical protein